MHSSFYNFMPILLKFYCCSCHGLIMLSRYNLQMFLLFISQVERYNLPALLMLNIIYSGYLVCATL